MVEEPRTPDNERTGGVTIGDVFGGIWNSIIAGGAVIVQTFTGSDERRALRNRQAMLELVKSFWVKGVLEQSLHGAAMIELGMVERAEAVERPWDMVLQMPDRPNRQLPPGTKIKDVFDEMNRILLILGEPGSGKTTILLDLARDTIARAKEALTEPIPVVFNLCSWTEKRQPLAEWLVEELNTKYHISRRIAQPWVENDDLLLLLDGLDEVAAEHRGACVEEINAFRQEHGLVPIVVCSRVADYETLTTSLKLQGAVLLQPLTPEQIDQYLVGAGTELSAVRKALQQDPALQEMAQTPLMLSVMTLTYRGMSAEELGDLDSVEARRGHLLDAYVQRMFERRSVEQPYSPEQTTRWLAWLADKMVQHGKSIFLIEELQSSWLQTRAQRLMYVDGVGLVFFVIPLLYFYAAFILFGQPIDILAVSLFGFYGLIPGLFVVARASRTRIRTYEVSRWPTPSVDWIVAPVALGLVGGVVAFLVSRDNLGLGLLAGLGYGLFYSIFFHVRKGTRVVEVENTVTPNQGIWTTARTAALLGSVLGLSFALVAVMAFRMFSILDGTIDEGFAIESVIAGATAGVFFAMLRGGLDVVLHFDLRLVLSVNNHTPWNYARFLDYATKRVFLRKVGGGYIFVHRLLRDYFASLYQEQ